MRNFQLPVPKPGFDPENERQMRAAVAQHLQDLSQVNEGALAFTDLTLADASITKHGLLPKLPNDATKFLDGTGNWTVPGGGGTGTGWTPLNWTMPHVTPPAPIDRSGWTASASASGGGTPASQAIDGNTGTRWATGAAIVAGTTYFRVDMGTATTVAAFQINNNSTTGDFPASGDVQHSDDGTTWTTVASWTNRDMQGGLLSKSWTASTHRYWQLLAQSTATGGAGNWWSIYEINMFASTYPSPVYQLANQSFNLSPQTVLWARGMIRKAETTDTHLVGFALDANNWYGLVWGYDTSTLLLVKVVAGTQTTLESLSFDNDTEGHVFELAMVIPNGSGVDNWLSLRAIRTNNPVASASYHDSALDFTNAGAGSAGAGKFVAFGQTDAPYRGWSFNQLDASAQTAAPCTIAYGGDTVAIVGAYKVHTFVNAGQTFTVEQVGNGGLSAFLVGGGGGGASGGSACGGSGGAIVSTSFPLKVGSYAVTIGQGGAAGNDGTASQFAALTPAANGGAKGTTSNGGMSPAGSGYASAPGGYAGGTPVAYDDGLGNTGYAGGGGGGAGGAGANGQQLGASSPYTELAGAGGHGAGGYGGGGDGGVGATGSTTAEPGVGNADGGGATGAPGRIGSGGGGGGATNSGTGGAGGSGTIILSYLYDASICG